LLFGSQLLTAVSEFLPTCCCFLSRIPLRSPSCCVDCILAVVIVDLEPQILFASSNRSRFLSLCLQGAHLNGSFCKSTRRTGRTIVASLIMSIVTASNGYYFLGAAGVLLT
jgi:hypothetical protein